MKYLGYAKDGSNPDNTGGFVGYSYGTTGLHHWIGAT